MSMLENIRVLVRAVELGSFSAAGRSMRLSAAVVSHRIRSLEQQLGCRLFNRTTRKMHLTEQGRAFYEHSLDVCQALDRAEASIADKGAAPRGTLKVTAPLGFGTRVVAPLLPRFQAKHPEIDVFLRLSDYLVDLFTEAVDVAVRMAILEDSSLIVRKIADIERTLCASPSYLERHGMPRSIADLQRHRCLLLRYPGSNQFKWPLQKKGGRHIGLRGNGVHHAAPCIGPQRAARQQQRNAKLIGALVRRAAGLNVAVVGHQHHQRVRIPGLAARGAQKAAQLLVGIIHRVAKLTYLIRSPKVRFHGHVEGFVAAQGEGRDEKRRGLLA